MIIAESLSCGVPVISAPVPAAIDHITEGFNGAVVPFEDHESISDAVEGILQSNDLLKELSENAREYASRNLGWQILAERYRKVYTC